MSLNSIEREILQFRKSVITKRIQKLARNNLLLQRGRFDLQEEWERKRDERSQKLKEISEKLYPEKYKKY